LIEQEMPFGELGTVSGIGPPDATGHSLFVV
jgi:hypothetical protein